MCKKHVLCVVASCIMCVPAYSQTLVDLRIDGPDHVVENTVTPYFVVAIFDDGSEFDVTLNSILNLIPGEHASINTFGRFESFEIPKDQIETIQAFYSSANEDVSVDLPVTIIDLDILDLVVDRIRHCGRIFSTPVASYPNEVNDAIRTFDRDGNSIDVLMDKLVHSSRAAPSFGLNGEFVLSHTLRDEILVTDYKGEFIRFITGGGMDGPTGTAIDPDGNIAVGSFFTDSVKFFTIEGEYIGELKHPGTEDPHSLAYDQRGNLYVASRNNANGRIAVYDKNLNFIRYIGEGILLPHPIDLAFDSEQNLWVVMTGSIKKFTRDGELLDTIEHAQLDPCGIAIDENNSLYVTNWLSHEIFVFTNEGLFERIIPIELGADVDPKQKLCGIAFEIGPYTDCDNSGSDDACEISEGSIDCNHNFIIDSCDINETTSDDCNVNALPDECEPDFDLDSIIDECDDDIDNDGVLNDIDECDFTIIGSPINKFGRPIGDVNNDCNLGITDFSSLNICLSGSGPNQAPPNTICNVHFDFDGDTDIDLHDFSLFQRFFVAE